MAGAIIVHTGPMKSGKTLALLNAYYSAVYAGKAAKLFYPADTNRWGDNEIVSRAFGDNQKISAAATELKRGFATTANCADLVNLNNQFIGFDEAQFLDISFVKLISDLRDHGDNVIHISGLDMDYNGIPFGTMPYFMAIADQVIKYTATCADCKEAAQHSWYDDADHKGVEHIGDELYSCCCHDCFGAKHAERTEREMATMTAQSEGLWTIK